MNQVQAGLATIIICAGMKMGLCIVVVTKVIFNLGAHLPSKLVLYQSFLRIRQLPYLLPNVIPWQTNQARRSDGGSIEGRHSTAPR